MPGGSSRFAIAVHVLTLMARRADEMLKSEAVALSVNTNPVVIRRVVCALAARGLVVSQTGAAGGTRLARAPEQITLLEVYEAVEGGGLVALHRRPPDRRCPVGMHIEDVLARVLREAEDAFAGVLARISVADVLAATVPRKRGRCRTAR